MALPRQVGLAGAIALGLGSIVGTGVFVSLGLAAGVAGTDLVPALALAGAVAAANGLSSARLAAAFPVSGGTYEYGHRTLGPGAGFTAGWLFLAAKTASAATAALGAAGYLVGGLGILQVPVAVTLVAAVTGVAQLGARRSGVVNRVLVALTLGVLAVLVALALPALRAGGRPLVTVPGADRLPDVLRAAAILFVSFTGYGRIATLGEEVVDPARTVPRAILGALAAVLALYAAVAVTALGTLGAEGYAAATVATGAPLRAVAAATGHPLLPGMVSVAAVTAMVGVLLNLVLGLSRVVLAMARRGDLPAVFARIDDGVTPGPAVWLTGAAIAAVAAVGRLETTWSFSALTVLVYYALTNLAALRLPATDRRFPAWTSLAGLVGCLSLAVYVEPAVWAAGLALVGAGHLGRAAFRRSA